MRTPEEFVSFGQANLEAFVKSGQIWAAGMQDLSKQVAANTQAQLDSTMSTFKAMTAVKSLKEAMDLQGSLLRATVETAMSQTGAVAEAGMKLAEQASAPLAARMSLAVDSFKAA